MNNCTVRHMRQMGIEARNGGAIKAVNCLIVENQFHGVAIGPQGIGYISEILLREMDKKVFGVEG